MFCFTLTSVLFIRRDIHSIPCLIELKLYSFPISNFHFTYIIVIEQGFGGMNNKDTILPFQMKIFQKHSSILGIFSKNIVIKKPGKRRKKRYSPNSVFLDENSPNSIFQMKIILRKIRRFLTQKIVYLAIFKDLSFSLFTKHNNFLQV